MKKVLAILGILLAVALLILAYLLWPRCSAPRAEWCNPPAEGITPAWDGAYRQTPPDLCPPDGEANQKPIFEDTAHQEEYAGQQVWVQRGLLINPQGELFRMEVIGPERDAVQHYSGEVQVCFDLVLAGAPTTSEPDTSTAGPELPPDVLRAGGENLIINVELAGAPWEAWTPEEEKAWRSDVERTMRSVMGKYPADEWLPVLQNNLPDYQVISAQEWVVEMSEDLVIDFILDPRINKWVFHNYPARCKTSATATFSVSSGAGKVTGYLYRNSGLKQSGTVTKGGIQTRTLSHSSAPAYSTYDLGAYGRQNGSKYRVSGRWSYGYNAAAPGGGGTPCTP